MDKDIKEKALATQLIHAGEGPCPITGAMIPPIYQTVSYIFKDVDDGAKKCEKFDHGYCYTRLGHPTEAALEKKIADIEGGEAALAFASGVAAISALLLSKLSQGDHVIADATCYSATHYLLDSLLKKFGVETTFTDTSVIKNVEDSLQNNTRLIYCESPANPTVKLVDIREIARIAKHHGILSVLDGTFASPYLQKPLELGMDAVIHSATKYICGHGDSMGGLIISTKQVIDELRDDTLKNIGGIISPFNAYLIMRGLKTLSLRMTQHCESAMAVAKFLEGHPKVERVYYPGLASHPQHDLAKQQMRDFGGILCFEVKGGMNPGITLMNSVQLCSLAVSLGHTETLIEHPASMTHWYVSKEEREQAGISDGLVRLSAGLEDAQDIIDDLGQALDNI